MGIADLHLHTIYSYDGTATVPAVLKRAKQVGLDLIAITDHDEIRRALLAEELAARFEIQVIPGVEITTGEGDLLALKPLVDIPRMAEQGASMLHRALAAFINEYAKTARLIPPEDDLVDNLYIQVYRELMTYILADPKAIERANWLLWAAHNLECFADRVTNICERTEFVVNGEYRETPSESEK